jgi:hypothetical protein
LRRTWGVGSTWSPLLAPRVAQPMGANALIGELATIREVSETLRIVQKPL